ncbi:MAG: VWA domain-containing protein [Pseudomonadota bacterium]
MRPTRFPDRAAGPADRVSGFLAHLRMNGLAAAAQETQAALNALSAVDATNTHEARLALKTLLASGEDAWRGFDDLFDAYWFNTGKQKAGEVKADHLRTQAARPTLWQPHFDKDTEAGGQNTDDARPDIGDGEAEGADGRLVATRTDNLTRRDLRELMDDESLRAAEKAAERLAKSLRDRRSRRHKAAKSGQKLDMRRILRTSLGRGGEPLDLHRRRRPERPLHIVALCDVSGSMTVYARVFLAFVKGLVSVDTRTDAYLFHTKLMRVTGALRDHDTLRAARRLSLMAEGFGGGTDIAGSLARFNETYARNSVGGRTVVFILSDGYCTSSPSALETALVRLRRRARRIVWLNPLLGWKDYAPIARGMAAARPHLDAHLPANTIEALAALDVELEKI